MTKQEIVDRIQALEAELVMLRELLAEWPDGEATLFALDEEPPDTDPQSPSGQRRSSGRHQAVDAPIKKD